MINLTRISCSSRRALFLVFRGQCGQRRGTRCHIWHFFTERKKSFTFWMFTERPSTPRPCYGVSGPGSTWIKKKKNLLFPVVWVVGTISSRRVLLGGGARTEEAFCVQPHILQTCILWTVPQPGTWAAAASSVPLTTDRLSNPIQQRHAHYSGLYGESDDHLQQVKLVI